MYIHKPLRITKGNNSHRNGPSSLLFIIIICPVDMNVYARFDEIPSITLKDIKNTKRYGQTDARTTWKQYTRPQTQFAGGINISTGMLKSLELSTASENILDCSFQGQLLNRLGEQKIGCKQGLQYTPPQCAYQNPVNLSKIIFSALNFFMHIFNMSVTYLPSIKKIHWKL